jgi:hypothetical protein
VHDDSAKLEERPREIAEARAERGGGDRITFLIGHFSAEDMITTAARKCWESCNKSTVLVEGGHMLYEDRSS